MRQPSPVPTKQLQTYTCKTKKERNLKGKITKVWNLLYQLLHYIFTKGGILQHSNHPIKFFSMTSAQPDYQLWPHFRPLF